ncbi:MAG TPA: metalloregulator ArsR/SmtB family transcription factor [Candidatus Synoicihabitans sp.]|nr:metalloregulator ArsR/SmtB family transcription factor [Candidatus Synoicihabitans sp.]
MESFSALADPTRRRIVELLALHDRTAGEIVGEFEVSAPAISQHLKVLRESGLVRVRARGQHRIHSLEPRGLDELEEWLVKTRRLWNRRLDALERAMREDETTPEQKTS